MHSVMDNFNPHSHEGSDPHGTRSEFIPTDFNPHSHEGSDNLLRTNLQESKISIHTPMKGVTDVALEAKADMLFQSTLP